MSDVDVRPAPTTRGRSSIRGGRGGFGRGGPRMVRKPTNGTPTGPADAVRTEEDSLEDQGELGEMKKKYAPELGMLKEMFTDWTDVDLLFALQETDGDLPSTIDKITQGNVSQFAEVKKAKDRARSKAKEESAAAGATDKLNARGGRGRGGFEGTRGGRGRGSDRGRGGLRGGRGGHATTTNGTLKDASATSVPTAESSAWDAVPVAETTDNSWDTTQDAAKDTVDDAGQSSWGNVVTAEATPAAASEGMKSSLIPEGGPKKSWASMFSQPRPAPVLPPAKQAPVAQPLPAELAATEQVPAISEQPASEMLEMAPPPAIQELPIEAIPEPAVVEAQTAAEQASIAPIQAPLTEENVETLPDKSHPPATETVISTTGSVDTRHLTPLPAQQAPIGRPPTGGFAATAYRAAGLPVRSASFQRRVQEQQEAVVMPGHNAVDRATVQFGSMGLNGEPGPDVDEDREEPETRQAPQHSPPSQPRTSLPPAPRQAVAPHEAPEGLPTPKPAPGLPPASTHNQQQIQEANAPPGITQEQSQMNASYNQYRYAQPGMQQDSTSQQQKPYDPFAHQAPPPSQYDQYGTNAPAQQAPQQQHQPQQQNQSQSGFGGLSSAPNDYSAYYTSDQPRNVYNQYYGGSYGQQDTRGPISQNQQDAGLGQQRSASGFGAGPNESAFQAQSQQQQAQSRFGEAPGSGQNTPNPLMAGQQHSGPTPQQSQHSMHQAQAAHQQQQQQQQGGYPPGASAAYPYGHPYYSSPYQTAYANQFGYTGGYGGGYQSQSKQQGAMYNVPQGYGQSSYEQHAGSPANTGAFAANQQSSMRNASGANSTGLGGGVDDYSRASAQSGSHQQSSAFGGMGDPFARTASGFGGQAGYGQQGLGAAGPDDSLKPFNDSKSGPSPALGQPGRPGSAANSAVGSAAQTGLPPPQSQQSGFAGGYPGFPGQGSQYSGLGGLGNHQQQGQQSAMGGQAAYGSYGGGFSQSYGYGSQQQRGGWGSNYGAH